MHFYQICLSFGRRILSTPGLCHTREMKVCGGISSFNLALVPQGTLQGSDSKSWLWGRAHCLPASPPTHRLTFPCLNTTFNACCKSAASVPLLLKLWERDCMLEKSKGLKLTAVHPAPRCAIGRAMSDLEPSALCAPVPSLLPTPHITHSQHSSTWSLLTLV